MQTIIIGREGSQAFPITNGNGGVSRQHCSISIDNGTWMLEDRDSANGTYIQDGGGQWHQVQRVQISPDTLIRLGDATVQGITFRARQALKMDYSSDFNELEKRYRLLQDERESIKKNNKNRRIIIALMPMVGLVASLFFEGTVAMAVMRLALVASSLLSIFLSGNEAQEQWAKKRRELRCPNPQCRCQLNDDDIVLHQCPRCKAR